MKLRLHDTVVEVSIIILLICVEPSITAFGDINSDYDADYPEDEDFNSHLQSRSFYHTPGEPPHLQFMEPKHEYINFTLYTRNNPKGTVFNISHGTAWMEGLSSTLDRHFDKTKPSKFITHGWISSGETTHCTVIRDSYMDRADANIFVVDFSNYVQDYFYIFTSVPAIRTIAQFYSAFLDRLVDHHGADPKSFHLIGHSYGAHISGFAARGVQKGRVGRVTGLDPAGPGFGRYGWLTRAVNFFGNATLHWLFNDTALDHLDHMSRNDADFVDVIHTGSGVLGMARRMGHADFYPNGGWTPQPGCQESMIFGSEYACSHALSWKMFVESVKHADAYKAYRCNSYKDFLNDRRNCSEDYVFMGDPVVSNASGKYYLKTWYETL